jgi:hypothetical protein
MHRSAVEYALRLGVVLAFCALAVGAEAGGVALLLLAAGAKWALVGVVIAVAGPGLAKGPRPEALPKAY